MWNADRLQVLHRRNERAVIDVLIALEANLSNLYFGTFANHKSQTDGGGRNGTDFAADRGKLAPVLGKQIF